MPLNKTLPAGRMVQGNPYKLKPSTDNNGVVKLGKDNKPIMTTYLAVAIPKTVATGNWWWHEAWGAEIFQLGAAEMPQNYSHKDFAWKIEDGDSQEVNKKGIKNCDREGFPGNWIVKLSSTFLPQFATLINTPGGKPVSLMQENAIKAGDYVQVNLTALGNKRTDSPGIYMNPSIVCLVGYGPAIAFGVDLDDAGFGGPMPAGASATPVGMPAGPGAPTALPGQPLAPPPVAMAPVPGQPAAPPPAAAPVPVQPHTTITMPAAPPVPAAPATTPGSQWNRTATWPAGADDAAMAGVGWTEPTLRQHGYIV